MKGVIPVTTAVPRPPLSDEEIIGLLFARSEDGLAQLQAKYGRSCLRIAKNVLHNDQDAEECVNDTYLKIWESIPPNRPASLLSYALTVVRHIALNRRERDCAAKRIPQEACVPLSELGEYVEDIALPDGEQSTELHRILSEFMDTLSNRDAVIFTRRYWYLDSVRAIAKMSGYTENNIYQRLFVMRGKLREHLIREGYPYETE